MLRSGEKPGSRARTSPEAPPDAVNSGPPPRGRPHSPPAFHIHSSTANCFAARAAAIPPLHCGAQVPAAGDHGPREIRRSVRRGHCSFQCGVISVPRLPPGGPPLLAVNGKDTHRDRAASPSSTVARDVEMVVVVQIVGAVVIVGQSAVRRVRQGVPRRLQVAPGPRRDRQRPSPRSGSFRSRPHGDGDHGPREIRSTRSLFISVRRHFSPAPLPAGRRFSS